MSWFNSQPQNDIERGREAMVYFHNSMVGYPGYELTLDEMIEQVSKGKPQIFLEGLGFAIISIDMRESQVRDAMTNLAAKCGGRMPANNVVFTNALSNRIQNISLTDWVYGSPEIALNIGKDVVKGAQQVGDTILTTAGGLLAIAPLGIIAAVVFIGYMRTRKIAGG